MGANPFNPEEMIDPQMMGMMGNQPDMMGDPMGGMLPPLPEEPPLISEETRYVLEPPDLQLDEEMEGQWAKGVMEKIRKAISETSDLRKDWEIARAQFDGKLAEMDSEDSTQSAIDSNTTFKRFQNASARMITPIIQQDPVFTVKERFPRYWSFALSTEKALDYYTDKADFQTLGWDTLRDSAIYKFAVVKVPFVKEEEEIKEWVTQEEASVDPMTGMQAREFVGRMVPKRVVVREGCFPEVVSPEDIIWYPTNSPSFQASEIVAERVRLQLHEAEKLSDGGYFRPGALAKCKAVTQDSSSSDTPMKQEDAKSAGLDSSTGTFYEVWEVYSYIPLPKDSDESPQKREQVIAVLDGSTSTVLRMKENFYSYHRIPYFSYQWERVRNQIPGKSVCERLEGAHRANNASLNIRLDFAALSAGGLGFTDDEDLFEELKDRQVRPGEWQLTARGLPAEHVMHIPMVAGDIRHLGPLSAEIEGNADQIMGTGPYSYGQEQIDRPTASGQVRLMENMDLPLAFKMDLFRKFLAKIAMVMLCRYRQFYPTGSPYVMGGNGVPLFEEVLQFPEGRVEDQIAVEVKATTAQLSPNIRKQEMNALADRFGELINIQMQLAQAAISPTPMGPFAKQALMVMQNLIRRVAEAFEMDPSEVMIDVEKGVQDGLYQILQQQGQAIQQLTGILQGGGNGGPGGPGGPSGPPPMAPEGIGPGPNPEAGPGGPPPPEQGGGME